MTVTPSPMDLASLSAVKSWLGDINGTGQDANLQACLTAASIFFLRQTGRGPRNWQNVVSSPFNESTAYVEVYDGISGQKLWLRNFPINSVSELQISGRVIPAANGSTVPGYTIDDQGRAIVLSAGGALSPDTFQYVSLYGNGYTSGYGALRNWRPFASGAQQIQISYMAGFIASPITNDLETVVPAWQAGHAYTTGQQVSDGTYLQTATNSGTSGATAPPWATQKLGTTKDGTLLVWVNSGVTGAPYTIQIQAQVAVLSDQGVSYFSTGTPLTKVLVSPSVGEYFLVAPGSYLFNAADMGVEMLMAYTLAGTPADIVLAVIQLVALNYKRRNWIGQRSIAMKDVGTTSYTLQMDPGIKEVISLYTRSSFSS